MNTSKQSKARNRYNQKKDFPDNSLPENHPLLYVRRVFKFINLVVLFVFLSIILGAIVIYTTTLTWSDPLMLLFPIAGVITGCYFAVRILKSPRYQDFDLRAKSSADISELTNNKSR